MNREVDDMHRHAGERKRLLARLFNLIFWQIAAACLLLVAKAALDWDSFASDLRSVLPAQSAIGFGVGLLGGFCLKALGSSDLNGQDLSVDNVERLEAHTKVQWISRPTLLDVSILFVALFGVPCFAIGTYSSSLGLARVLSKALNNILTIWSFGMGLLVSWVSYNMTRRQ
jgi:hypothetical protein